MNVLLKLLIDGIGKSKPSSLYEELKKEGKIFDESTLTENKDK